MVKLTQAIRFRWLLSIGWTVSAGLALAQPAPLPGLPLPLNDLSAFAPTTPNWRIAGAVRADLNKPNTLTTDNGAGVLVSLPLPANQASKLADQQMNAVSRLQHGDMDLELDFMIAPKSNSGVYLQGRYEIQLFDSWDIRSPRTIDNGSIYERWDEKRAEGQNGFEGHPARQNASRAPRTLATPEGFVSGTTLQRKQCRRGTAENRKRPHGPRRVERRCYPRRR